MHPLTKFGVKFIEDIRANGNKEYAAYHEIEDAAKISAIITGSLVGGLLIVSIMILICLCNGKSETEASDDCYKRANDEAPTAAYYEAPN